MNQGQNGTKRCEKSQQLADAALDQLAKALDAGHSEALKAWLTATSRFHRYSWTNVMLIAFQKPDATHVAGFNTWRKQFKRFVKRGEKGIMIMAPVTLRIGNAEEQRDDGTVESKDIHRIVNVKPVYVFDVSQTEGEPLPEFAKVTGEPADYVERLKAFIQSRGIALEYADALGGAMGSSHGGRIQILSGQTGAAEFSVLAHEYAHEALHRGERRTETSKTVRETEAEAVAFVVCQAIGLDSSTASSDYIQLYRGDKDTLAESLQYVRNVSAEILEALETTESSSFGRSDK
jgi:hypothetical protein